MEDAPKRLIPGKDAETCVKHIEGARAEEGCVASWADAFDLQP